MFYFWHKLRSSNLCKTHLDIMRPCQFWPIYFRGSNGQTLPVFTRSSLRQAEKPAPTSMYSYPDVIKTQKLVYERSEVIKETRASSSTCKLNPNMFHIRKRKLLKAELMYELKTIQKHTAEHCKMTRHA
ncbi:hypothetical protein L6164_006946 [Bauhinia variegata]|uniref:Uncharacterized protein n=1 Tax=Bauhinia variegata TaxID=167791 RepID=A0ACB9PWJ8_BAUVA|nr:hypothetical protein L6164_006946 [Bauhinia variegata]